MKIQLCRSKWKGTMSDRARFNNQMHFKAVDRCYHVEFGFWKDVYRTWPLFLDNHITNEDEAFKFLGFDYWAWTQAKIGLEPPFPQKIVSETENTRIMMDSAGLLYEVPKDGHDTIPRYLRSSVTTPDDWKRCKAEHLQRYISARKINIEEWKNRWPADRDIPLESSAVP